MKDYFPMVLLKKIFFYQKIIIYDYGLIFQTIKYEGLLPKGYRISIKKGNPWLLIDDPNHYINITQRSHNRITAHYFQRYII